MKNGIGQEITVGSVVTKGGDRNSLMRIGVVFSVDEEERTARINWHFESRWYNRAGTSHATSYGGRAGNCHANYLTMVPPETLELAKAAVV